MDPEYFMNRSEYIARVTDRLTKLFKASKAGYKLPDAERHRLEGFIQAGIFLKLITKTEMQDLMESTYISVFGKSFEELKKERSPSWQEVTIDYDQYDPPTFSR